MKLVVLALVLVAAFAGNDLPQPDAPSFACSLSGDPHFKTFDRINYDYMGVGWFDLVKFPGFRISSEFYACGGGSVSCMKNLVLWTNLCDGAVCPDILIAYQNAAWTMKINNNNVPTGDYATAKVVPLSVSITAQWTASSKNLVIKGCRNAGCSLRWEVQVRTGMVVITMNNPGGSSIEQWSGVEGLCGTPDFDNKNEFSVSGAAVTDSSTAWRSNVANIKKFGDQMNSSADPVSSAKVAAAGSNAATGLDVSKTYTPTQISAIVDCVAGTPGWTTADGRTECLNNVQPACLAEGTADSTAYLQCMFDYNNAWIAGGNARNQAYLDESSGWTNLRLTAASLYTGAITANESIMLGLFIGLGVGLVFIVAAVAFFAKNPELLPFTHKKKKVMKELAATDVLK